jgi:hypothetical protein
MRAIIEGVGALFGMPVSDGKPRHFRVTVLVAIVVGFAVLAWVTFSIR